MSRIDKMAPKFFVAGLLLIGVSLSTAGCVTGASHLMRVIYGNDTPPEFAGLDEQRVAIAVGNEKGILTDEQTKTVAALMQMKIANKMKDLDVVGLEVTESALRQNTSTPDPIQTLGEELKADLIIYVKMDGLSLFDGPTLYRGKANFEVEVFDVKKEKIVFRKMLPEYAYPQSAALATTEMSKEKFQRMYLTMAAERISYIFIPSPIASDVAADAKSLQYQ